MGYSMVDRNKLYKGVKYHLIGQYLHNGEVIGETPLRMANTTEELYSTALGRLDLYYFFANNAKVTTTVYTTKNN